MKWPCLAVKACQQHKYLIVLYIEKLLKHVELCFDHIDLTNAMVSLSMPSVLCDTNTGIT